MSEITKAQFNQPYYGKTCETDQDQTKLKVGQIIKFYGTLKPSKPQFVCVRVCTCLRVRACVPAMIFNPLLTFHLID